MLLKINVFTSIEPIGGYGEYRDLCNGWPAAPWCEIRATGYQPLWKRAKYELSIVKGDYDSEETSRRGIIFHNVDSPPGAGYGVQPTSEQLPRHDI